MFTYRKTSRLLWYQFFSNQYIIQYKSNQKPINFSGTNEQSVSKMYVKNKKPSIDKRILRKNKVGGFTLPNFKAYYKTPWSRWCGNYARIDIGSLKQNRESKNRRHAYGHLLFGKAAKVFQ